MEEDIKKDRAWIEINLDNLEYNINQIRSIVNKKSEIIAVVKADAYGHGMLEISKKLNDMKIENFAVATLSEAIKLRKANIHGEIIILGYTNFDDLKYINKYDLTQTIVDYDYAKKIANMDLKEKIKCHIKINTGMNRIGESYENINKLAEVYKIEKLDVKGTFSHLCVSDSLDKDDKEFTKQQINNFMTCINKLKALGINVGKIHIQASYGILNYPELECDFVRPGIIMYGVTSELGENINIELKPVLTLKARITAIKQIKPNETVSYGRTFIANKPTKIATVSIGYADGYPRNLSNKGVKVLVNKGYAEIIGRICMDQLVIDVSNIENIKQGDIAILIGEEKEITAQKIANTSGTITNELLCRLGSRLEKIEQ